MSIIIIMIIIMVTMFIIISSSSSSSSNSNTNSSNGSINGTSISITVVIVINIITINIDIISSSCSSSNSCSSSSSNSYNYWIKPFSLLFNFGLKLWRNVSKISKFSNPDPRVEILKHIAYWNQDAIFLFEAKPWIRFNEIRIMEIGRICVSRCVRNLFFVFYMLICYVVL